jgi:hypothetical protein
MAEIKPYKIEKWAGLNNVKPPEKKAPGELDTATNVDVDDAGDVIRMREGTTRVYSSASHSLWNGGDLTLFRQGTNLNRLNADFTATTLRSGLVGNNKMSYQMPLDRVYYSDGVITGIIDESGASRSWGLPIPSRPVLSETSGDLPAGKYQVCLTYVRTDGQEGGASTSALIDLTSGGGITISGISVSDDPGVDVVRLYITTTDGSVFYLLGWIGNGTTSATYRDNGANLNLRLTTQFLSPPPAGHILEFYNGRLYVAKDNLLYYSEPYNYELFNLAHSWIPCSGRISMVEPLVDGIWVSDRNSTFYLLGDDPGGFKKIDVVDYTAVEGTAIEVTIDFRGKTIEGALWTSDEGFCFGGPQGFFLNFSDGKYYPLSAKTGSAILRERRGSTHYLVSLEDASGAHNIYS